MTSTFQKKILTATESYRKGDIDEAMKIFNFICTSTSFTNSQIVTALEELYNISENTRFTLSKHKECAPQNDALELIQKLRDILPHSKDKEQVANLLLLISSQTFLPAHERFMCITCLYNNCFIDLCYSAFSTFGKEEENPLSLRIDAGYYLFSSGNEEFKEIAKTLISSIACSGSLSDKDRYDIIMRFGSKSGIQTNTNFSKIKVAFDELFFRDLQLAFFFNQENDISYRTLSAQCLLSLESVENKRVIVSTLFDIASESQITNAKANIADVIMRLSDVQEEVEKAKEIIEELGYGHLLTKKGVEKTKTIYNNSQNAHEFVDQSSKIISRVYKEYALDKTYNRTFDDIKGDILNLMSLYKYDEERKEKIIKVLHRIYIDTAKFADEKLTLEEIFTCLWYKITILCQTHPDLDLRVLDEIADVDDACSSGHFTRLVSVLCEYDGSMTIDFSQQIIANAVARMQALIRDCDDEDIKCHIALAQSVLAEEEDEKVYNEFIESKKIVLREELFTEFVLGGFVNEKEFEDAFSKAIETWII